jgi:hypothetical protein
MEKVTNPFSEPYPLWHKTHGDNLEKAMREGIIADGFRSRIGKTNYARNFHAPWNEKYVSLIRGSQNGADGYSRGSLAILVVPMGEIVSPSDEKFPETFDVTPLMGEFWVKDRIAPREFRGLQIEREDDLKGLILMMQKLDSSRALPVYHAIKGLIWPVKMTREQLRDHVKSEV